MIVKTPNPATAQSSVGPERPRNGRCASSTAIIAAPDSRSRPQQAQSPRPGMQNFARVNRKQRHRSAQHHREQVQRDRAQDELLASRCNAVRRIQSSDVIGSRGRAFTSGLMRNVEIVAPTAVIIAISIHRRRPVKRGVDYSSE